MTEPKRNWQSTIDQIIEEAQARGEFDLPDHLRGKPMREAREERFAGDAAMANKVLKNSGHAPPFLMKRQEIDDAVAEERTRLATYAKRRRRLLEIAATHSGEQAEALRTQAERDWNWAVGKMEARIPAINKEIDLYNLMNPIPSMFRMRLTLAREIERAEQAAQE